MVVQFLGSTSGDAVSSDGVYQVDLAKTPHTLDVTTHKKDGKKVTAQCIFEVKDDELKFCFGETRPTAFATKAGSGDMFLVFKRDKR